MYDVSTHLVAEVGLQEKLYKVHEEEQLLEVCVVVNKPSIECPVQFSFNVSIWTEDKDASKSVPLCKNCVIIFIGARCVK